MHGESPPHRLDRLYRSPPLLLAALAVTVFLSEAVVMVVLSQFTLLDHPLHYLLDSLMLLALLFPALIILVFRPIEFQLAQRRRTEEELAAERNKLRGILDAMPAGVCIVDQFHEIEYTNSSLLEEFGPVEGRKCHVYFQGWPDACPGCRIDEVFAGKSVTWEWHSEKTGKIFEIFDTPLRNADGTFSKLDMVRDITARKMAEDELRRSREQLRNLSAHLQAAREQERTRIAREIHDELGQVLAALQLDLSLIAGGLRDDQAPLAERSRAMARLIEGTVRTVQRISAELRPGILDDLGLGDAIEWQAREFQKRSGIQCDTRIVLANGHLDRDLATGLFRIFQETLTNVIRHAEATRVEVRLGERGNRITLAVGDDGRGISREQVRDPRSLGLVGMRERVASLGGRVRVCGGRQGGTTVVARIPTGTGGAQ